MSSPWIVAFLVLWAVVVLLAILVLGAVRRVAVVLERAEALVLASGELKSGLARGSRIGPFTAQDSAGTVVTEADLRGQPAVVVFVEPGCGPCKELIHDLNGLGGRPISIPLFIVTHDTVEERHLSLGETATVLYEKGGDVSAAFHNFATPYGYALDASGVVVDKAVANSVEVVRRLASAMPDRTNEPATDELDQPARL